MDECTYSTREVTVSKLLRMIRNPRIGLCPKCSHQFVIPEDVKKCRIPAHFPPKTTWMA